MLFPACKVGPLTRVKTYDRRAKVSSVTEKGQKRHSGRTAISKNLMAIMDCIV